jgi:hypothetical protein
MFVAWALAKALLAAAALAGSAAAAPAFRVADAVAAGGGAALLWLDPAWEGWRDRPARIEVAVEGEPAPRTIEPVMAGLHRLDGLAAGAPVAIRVRAATAGGAEPWSAPQYVVPTAESVARFAVWADGFEARTIESTVVAVSTAPMAGSTALEAGADAVNRPLRLPSGAELEYVGGPDSLFVRWFAYADPRNGSDGQNPAPNPVPEARWRIYEPGGRHADLAPLETREDPFFLRLAGDAADRPGAAVVLGGAGAEGWTAVSAVGLDADGDPVAFRFDRPALTGRHPDGRPWVVGPVRILRNGGPPVDAAPGDVVARDGALLSVVARPGLVPAPVATLRPDFDPAYARAAGPADWSGWDDAAPRRSDGLRAFAQFESLHLYLDGADPGRAEVRFRPVAGQEWFPAQPLLHDARVPEGLARAATPGAHRGVVLHLASGVAYEVEVRQGGRYWRTGAVTKSYKPRKSASIAVGMVDGDLTIDRGGAPGDYVEYRDGVVRGGGVRIAASHVILRDVDVLGSPRHGIELAPGVRDVRIVRGRISGWGESDAGRRLGNLGWGAQHEAAIAGGEAAPNQDPEHVRNDEALRARQSRADVAVIGTRIGSPRFPANAWEEWNPAIDGAKAGPPNTNEHPWGPYAVSIRHGSAMGGWTLTDLSASAAPPRSYNDVVGGDFNKTPGVGGFGPNFVLAYSYLSGAVDDLAEHEGSAQDGVVLGDFFDAVPARSYTRSPRSGLSLSTPYWGPTYVLRNVFRRRLPDFYEGRAVDGRAFKIQRDMKGGDDTGVVLMFHNTVLGGLTIEAMTGAGAPPAHIVGRNNLFDAPAAPSLDAPGMDWGNGAVEIPRADSARVFAGGDPAPRGKGAWSRGAVPLDNINDAGPWAFEGAPIFGAAGAAYTAP